MADTKKQDIIALFQQWAGENVISFVPLPPSGSYREYYRVQGATKSALGVYNADKKENLAFFCFTEAFRNEGLPVPEIYLRDDIKDLYLIQDLGDETLFSWLTANRKSDDYPANIIAVYKKVIDLLPRFQINAAKNIDYSVCYPRARFDKQSMMWDLNYFKYYFLKLAKVPFDEQALESDFHTFTDYLLQADCNFFLYRDFQSRNIMLKDDEPWFIDYQGGRQGSLMYDLASLLFDAKADLPQNARTELLHYYLDKVKEQISINEPEFIQMFFGYVLIRILQAMGAYGFRGFYEKKEHFLKSIPYAVENLAWLLNAVAFPVKVPALLEVLHQIVESPVLKQYGVQHEYSYKLQLSVNSFSYKHGIPEDESGNGGGFVFDCRAIHNPGRYAQYKMLTGNDEPVQKFLLEESDVAKFLEGIYSLIEQSVTVYTARKFTHLMVNFGCTGGQHRSVYCANMVAAKFKNHPEVQVTLRHRSLEKMQNKR
ncbi:MAG: phosphotransferase [Ignavibacteria bacterium]|nr:phosphotransferase [Ignavibacteria bacterium]